MQIACAPDCPCWAQMIRRVNPSDSYWCTVVYGLTMGMTPRIHSACLFFFSSFLFFCWEPPDFKLISVDSGETGWRLGCGEVKMASLEANHPYDSRSSHVDTALQHLSAACLVSGQQLREGALLLVWMWIFCLIPSCRCPREGMEDKWA